VHDAHVTRLQAENAALQQRLTIADQRVDDLESDIAAARELLKHGSSPTPAHCESVLDFLGQTAPVAKGGES
jgi:predicted  nucleic acid-binding Zn-ribbon protein